MNTIANFSMSTYATYVNLVDSLKSTDYEQLVAEDMERIIGNIVSVTMLFDSDTMLYNMEHNDAPEDVMVDLIFHDINDDSVDMHVFIHRVKHGATAMTPSWIDSMLAYDGQQIFFSDLLNIYTWIV